MWNSLSLVQTKRVIRLSLPMAGSRFLQMFSGFISTMMVSHLGREVLAACALINATLSTVLLVFMSVVFSLSFIVGQAYGAKKQDEIAGLLQQGMILSFVLGVLMTVCFFYADTILSWFHEKPDLLALVRLYFHALMWGAIPILLQSCLEQFFYGLLKQRYVITINFLSLLMGIPLAYVLIFGKFGFPDLGIAGLGAVFAIQSWVSFSALLLCCYKLKSLREFRLFQWRPLFQFLYLKKIFRIGWPISLQFGGELGAFFVVTMMIGWLGVNALAAVQITQQWMYLVIVPIFAMSEASGILVGQAVGAHQYDQLESINKTSLCLSLALVMIVNMGFICFPHFFATFYMNVHQVKNQQILHLIPPLFLMLAVTLIFNSLRDVITGSLRGLFDTQFPMYLGLFVMWCLVLPLGYLFGFVLHWDVIGFRLGSNIGLAVGAALIYWRWVSATRKYSV